MPSAIRIAWVTSRLASARRPAPRARAMADATPPPMPPADIVCISMTSGNTRDTPASAWDPSQPTKTASRVATAAWSSITSTVGAARRSRVRAIGPSSMSRVREDRTGADTADEDGAVSTRSIALPTFGLGAAQGHAGARGARHQAAVLVDHIALDEPDRVAAFHQAAGGDEPPGADGFEEVDLQLEGGEGLVAIQRGGVGHPHGGVGDVAQDAAMQRAHRVPVLGPGLERDHR